MTFTEGEGVCAHRGYCRETGGPSLIPSPPSSSALSQSPPSLLPPPVWGSGRDQSWRLPLLERPPFTRRTWLFLVTEVHCWRYLVYLVINHCRCWGGQLHPSSFASDSSLWTAGVGRVSNLRSSHATGVGAGGRRPTLVVALCFARIGRQLP